jgi:hypothetical protein
MVYKTSNGNPGIFNRVHLPFSRSTGNLIHKVLNSLRPHLGGSNLTFLPRERGNQP